jgi:hypothetical protein
MSLGYIRTINVIIMCLIPSTCLGHDTLLHGFSALILSLVTAIILTFYTIKKMIANNYLPRRIGYYIISLPLFFLIFILVGYIWLNIMRIIL